MNPLLRRISQAYAPASTTGAYQIPETVGSLLSQTGVPMSVATENQYEVEAPVPMPRPTRGAANLLAREGLLRGAAGQGDVMVYNLPPAAEMVADEAVEPRGSLFSGLSDIGSGLLGAGRAVARGAGLLGESLQAPIAAGVADIPEAMRVYEQMRAQGPMMAFDPSELSAVTPATAVARLPDIRAAREAEMRRLAIEEREAQARIDKMKPVKDDRDSDEAARQKAYGVISSVDDALAIIDKYGNLAAGWGSLTKALPTTPANLLDKSLDTIKAQIGFAELQAMRDASKTGGALGQVTERELQLLQRTIAAIEPDLSPDALRANLIKVREVMMAIAHGKQDPRTGEIVSIADTSPTTAIVRTYNPKTGELE